MTRSNVRRKRLVRALTIATTGAALLACASRRDSGGVYLPLGDAARGREAFVDLRCNACHEIEGFDAPTPIIAETRVLLGGKTARVETYADLVTSIANPSHRITPGYPDEAVTVDGVPLMTLINLNAVMTVQQLVDLAAFLQTTYEVAAPPMKPAEVYPSAESGNLSRQPAR